MVAHAASDSATYTYDTLGRLQKITFANGKTVIYTYDSEGNFVSVVAD